MPQYRNLRRYALLLQIILVTQFALAFLRVFATSGVWGIERFYIFDFRYLPAGMVVLIILTVLSPWLLLKRIHSLHLVSWWTYVSTGLGIFRVAEQLTHNAIGDYFFASGGIILFIVYFSIIYQAARSRGWIRGNMIATGIAIAVMLDTALRGALWTLDLSWQPGLWPIIVVTILSATLAALSFVIKPKNGQAITSPKFPLAWGLLLVGFYFFFIQHLFGGISRILQNTGYPLEISLFLLLAGNYLGVLGTRWASMRNKKKLLHLLPGFFLLGTIFLTLGVSGWQYIAVLYLIEITNGVMIAIVLDVIFSAPGDKNILRTRKVYLVSFITYILSVMIFYATGMLNLIFIPIGVIVAAIFWETISVNTSLRIITPLRHKAWISIFIVLLLPLALAPLSVKHNQTTIDPITRANSTITVMQLNMHQGIDSYGHLSLPQQAAFIRENDVDIVSLNEVSRGSLWSGSTDTLLWLSHELGMYAAYGPTMGHMSGNAFLSKLPFEEVHTQLYSQKDSIFPSGCVTIDISLNGQIVQLVSTHVVWSKIDAARTNLLERNTGSLPERVNLFQSLVNTCVNTSKPSLIMGDMNVKPNSEAIQVLQAAGLTDAAETSPNADTFTWHTTLPLRRIDYIFGSPEIFFESYQVAPTVLSDHFPIITSLHLQGKLTNAK
ncbi:MAG: hypothetical protein B6243_03265 [Anaerolineaceae bacterium 4572_5.2]|nr:MAG: hypothetical protein B6243_03265 [Anaerolineaceae bacterium 4572_5.2]